MCDEKRERVRACAPVCVLVKERETALIFNHVFLFLLLPLREEKSRHSAKSFPAVTSISFMSGHLICSLMDLGFVL